MSVNKRLKKRLLKDRPMTSISIRMPEDVLDDLKEIAPGLGFSGYQALIRFYIGQSLRKDLARKESGPVAIMAESLRRHGVSDAVIEEAVAEAMTKNPWRFFRAHSAYLSALAFCLGSFNSICPRHTSLMARGAD